MFKKFKKKYKKLTESTQVTKEKHMWNSIYTSFSSSILHLGRKNRELYLSHEECNTLVQYNDKGIYLHYVFKKKKRIIFYWHGLKFYRIGYYLRINIEGK